MKYIVTTTIGNKAKSQEFNTPVHAFDAYADAADDCVKKFAKENNFDDVQLSAYKDLLEIESGSVDAVRDPHDRWSVSIVSVKN